MTPHAADGAGRSQPLAQIAQLPLPVPSADTVADVADRDHAATFVGRSAGEWRAGVEFSSSGACSAGQRSS